MTTTLSTDELARLSELTLALEHAKHDKDEQKVIKQKLMSFFEENGIRTYRYGDIVITYTPKRSTNEFDVDLLREKYPEIWEECHSVQERDAHIQVKRKPVIEESDESEENESGE